MERSVYRVLKPFRSLRLYKEGDTIPHRMACRRATMFRWARKGLIVLERYANPESPSQLERSIVNIMKTMGVNDYPLSTEIDRQDDQGAPEELVAPSEPPPSPSLDEDESKILAMLVEQDKDEDEEDVVETFEDYEVKKEKPAKKVKRKYTRRKV